MAQQIQIYFKSVATVEVNDGLTQQQIDTFLQNTYAITGVKSRLQNWRDSFKVAVRYLVGRPAAVSAGARIVSWHFHMETGDTVEEPEP